MCAIIVDYNIADNFKSVVIRVIKYQITQGAIAVLALSLWYQSKIVIISSILGLLLAVIPTVVYAKLTISKKVENYLLTYKKHKTAMIIKFIVNGAGFLLVFSMIKNLSPGVLFSVYIIALSGHWTSIFGSSFKK